jgi:choline dehydrogenase-like flavoprotein
LALVLGRAHGGPFRERARVVVVGTGAGGSACAKELAEAGLSVIALDSGEHWTADSVDQREETTYPRLYAEGGRRGTRDKSLLVVQGRGIGGSTLHNTGLCFRTPAGILKAWEKDHGLSLDLGPHLERVERHLGVRGIRADEVNPMNDAIARGARALGLRHLRANHNREDCEGCGYCVLGCAYDKKQSMGVTYVPRALAAGATLVSDARVERISRRAGKWLVRGSLGGKWALEVEGEALVLAAGAIDTPNLLLRSGLGNRLVGRSLRLHPACPVGAIFKETVRAFRGVPQSIIVTEHAPFLEDPAARGGWLFLPAFGHPATTGLLAPGLGLEHWGVMRAYDRLAVCGVMLHDETRGRVRPGWLGIERPRIDYWPSPEDQRQLREGVKALGRLWFAAGAEAVVLPFARAPLARSEGDLAGIDGYPFSPHEVALSSVHPQGTCPMGADDRVSVLDPSCEVRGAPGLYVADTSVFPTSVGVPPQITTAALATRTARIIAERLGRGGLA